MLVQDPSGFLFGAGMDPPALVSSEDPQRRVCDRGINAQGLPRRDQGVPAEERMIPGRTREQVPLRGPQRIEVVAQVPTDFVEIHESPIPRLIHLSGPATEACWTDGDDSFTPGPFPFSCQRDGPCARDRKSTRLNSSHRTISYAVFCLKKK